MSPSDAGRYRLVPTVWIPAPWRDKLTGGVQQVEVEAATVRQVVEALEALYPGMRERIIDPTRPDPTQECVRHDIAVAVDGEITVEGLRHRVESGSEVHFLPAMAGG